MSDLKLNAYYYSFAPTGQREVDLILHAVARAGKAFHHTSQWTEDEMAEFYEHCEGNTCVEWIQNAANKAAAELAALRADAAEAWRQVHLLKAETSGPDGFATWKDAATDERVRRVKAEAEAARLRALNLALQQKALDGYRAWDLDQDAKAGKVLKALAGLSPGYWPDIDALRAALGKTNE